MPEGSPGAHAPPPRFPPADARAATPRRPSRPIALLALSKTELTSLDPRVDQNQRVNVHKRLMWEKAEKESSLLPATLPQRGYPDGGSLTDAWIWPFLWQGNTSLFTGMFKLVEDRLNAHVDTQHGVQARRKPTHRP